MSLGGCFGDSETDSAPPNIVRLIATPEVTLDVPHSDNLDLDLRGYLLILGPSRSASHAYSIHKIRREWYTIPPLPTEYPRPATQLRCLCLHWARFALSASRVRTMIDNGLLLYLERLLTYPTTSVSSSSPYIVGVWRSLENLYSPRSDPVEVACVCWFPHHPENQVSFRHKIKLGQKLDEKYRGDKESL